MFRTLARLFLPNPLDWMLRRTAKKGGKRILLGWNRGLGDIALGLFAIVQRIREIIPDAEITFITRENLTDGFAMLEGVKTLIDPSWKRGVDGKIDKSIRDQFDLVIEKPSPTDWVPWQRGKVTPRLKWNVEHDHFFEKFQMSSGNTKPQKTERFSGAPRQMSSGFTYVGVQAVAETNYGLWRNWSLEKWEELFRRLEKFENVRVLLFGFGSEPKFVHRNVIDLRGKTNLFELLSIIKNCCHALVLPDSGISSMTYYLDASFPLRLVTLWADPNHGILKQGVPSPNPQLIHCPIIAKGRDLSTVTVDAVIEQLFPIGNSAAILLAGGQGTRLGFPGPKGLFVIEGKSLFQWFCEKVPKHLPLAVMTSPLNHHETVAYFREQGNFGLEVHFFQQDMEPLLDEEKKPLPLSGPNGNGSVFRSFVKSGLADLFAKKGIDLITVSNIENPLARPFDPELIACARAEKADAVVQCIERHESDRSMGVLVEKEGSLQIIEYTELDPSQEYRHAYSGQMAFSFDFFCKMAEVELPIHWVKKKNIWKGERFIFDVLPYAKRARSFCVKRETHFAPLKGPESISLVQKLLREKV